MRPYETAVEMHREILDMGSRERAEHRILTAFVDRFGHQIVADPSFTNPPVVMLLRILAEINPVLAVDQFDDEQWEIFKRESRRLLDNPASYAKRVTRVATQRLAEAATVWASPDIVERAQQTAPEDVIVPDRQSLPFERAFVTLAEPVATAGEQMWKIEAISWDVLSDHRMIARTYGRLHDEGHPLDGTLQPDMVGLQRFGKAMVSRDEYVVEGMDAPDTDVHGALTFRIMSLLARQVDDEDAEDVRVAVTDASGDRDAKRAARKAEIKPEVNVIYVADEKSRALKGRSGGTGSTSRHRVRAHWRHQPYGPERSLRRWVLVAEHERGKGDLDDRDRVYVEK